MLRGRENEKTCDFCSVTFAYADSTWPLILNSAHIPIILNSEYSQDTLIHTYLCYWTDKRLCVD
jgi:hypothetical protein